MLYLVAYDIADKKRLRKTAKFMEGVGIRTQKSVFECKIDDTHIKKFEDKIKNIINPQEDKFQIYPLTKKTIDKRKDIGITVPNITETIPDCIII